MLPSTAGLSIPYAKGALLVTGYMLLAAFGSLLYAGNNEVAYFWPANALAATILTRSKRREWPFLLALIVPAEGVVDLYFGLSLGIGLALGAINASEAGLVAWLIRRFIPHQRTESVSLSSLWRFVGVCALAPAASACLGAVVLLQTGMGQSYLSAWRMWWVGDAVGLLLCAPAFWVVAEIFARKLPRVSTARWLEGALLVAVLLWVAYYAFGPLGVTLASRSIVFPILVWSAVRFGLGGAAWALVGVALIAVWSDLNGRFSFTTHGDAEVHAMAVQVFLAIASVTTLALASALSERRWLLERFRRVAEATPSGIVMIDPRGAITFANAQAQRMFGYAQDELLGLNAERLVPEPSKGATDAGHTSFLVKPEAWPPGRARDVFVRRKDGSQLAVEIGLNPVQTEDGPMTLAAIVDVSERKQAEQRLRDAYEEKEVLLKEVYHRVKNNLQIVSSLISLQARNLTEQAAREALVRGEARIHSMALVHEQLYNSENLATLNAAGYLETLVRYLRTQFGGVTRVNVEGDWVALGMDQAIPCGLIVTELVTNAHRHAFPDGRPGEIWVRLKQSRAEGDSLILEVSDNGVGLPAGFEQQQRSSLGWVLVQSLAKQLGGLVTVRRDQGTIVQVSFPVKSHLEAAA